MKGKIMFLSAILASVAALTSSVGILAEEKEPDSMNEENATLQSWNSILEDRGSQLFEDVYDDQMNVALEDLTVYNYRDFVSHHGDRRISNILVEHLIYCLGGMNKILPIERIEEIDDRNLYVVYKVQGEDIGQAYLYARYTDIYPMKEYADITHPLYSWCKTGEYYFVSQKMSSEDFADMKIGDSFASACAIDPAIAFDVTAYERYGKQDDPAIYSDTYRLLTDGVLWIEFKLTDTNMPVNVSSYAVSDMKFYPYGSEPLPEYVTATKFPDSFR